MGAFCGFRAVNYWTFSLRWMTKCTGHDTEEALVAYFGVREIRTPNLMSMKQQTRYLKIKEKIIHSPSITWANLTSPPKNYRNACQSNPQPYPPIFIKFLASVSSFQRSSKKSLWRLLFFLKKHPSRNHKWLIIEFSRSLTCTISKNK